MQDNLNTGSEQFMGELQHLYTSSDKSVVFVPFICKRCGKCCREISVHPQSIAVFSVAEHLRINPGHLIEHYFGEVISYNGNSINFKVTKPWKPCPFLKGNLCSIYPLRPSPCRSFPICTDFGTHGIGCPGRAEADQAIKSIGRGFSYSTTSYCEAEPPSVNVPEARQEKILAKYLKSNPSAEHKNLFIAINHLD